MPGENCKPGNCPLVARCESKCDMVKCPANTTCQLIFINCLAGSNCTSPIAKCVPKTYDPCEQYQCPKGQGCYKDEKNQPYCQDPCVKQNIKCTNGKICYPEDVDCVKAPCNPIPVCKNPCDTIHCEAGSICKLLNIKIICTKPICRPSVICVANKTNEG